MTDLFGTVMPTVHDWHFHMQTRANGWRAIVLTYQNNNIRVSIPTVLLGSLKVVGIVQIRLEEHTAARGRQIESTADPGGQRQCA